MTVLAICNQTTTNLGYVAERFEAHGLGQVTTVYREKPETWPDCADFELVISTGSVWSVTDDEHAASLRHETDMYRRAVAADVPVLAICYGAHVLAAALGAPAREAPQPEAGLVRVDTADPGLIPPGPWLTWHEDLLTVPTGVTVLARTPVAPQAWQLGRTLALQFHPELTPDELATWIGRESQWLKDHGVDGDNLVAEARHREAELRERAHTLFDAYWTRIVESPRY